MSLTLEISTAVKKKFPYVVTEKTNNRTAKKKLFTYIYKYKF